MDDSAKLGIGKVLGVTTLVVVVGFLGGRLLAKPADLQPAPEAPKAQAEAVSSVRYMIPVSLSQPVQGAGDALVTVVEWCDLRGKACAEMDAPRRALLARHAGKLRWVYRQLPDLSRSDSPLIHNVARGVFSQAGKFWELREQLMAVPAEQTLSEADLQSMVEKLGVAWPPIAQGLKEQAFARYVGVDMLFAKKFGVTRGPVLFVNGRRIPEVAIDKLLATLEPVVNESLAEAAWHVQQGVPAEQVYQEITKEGLWSIDDDPAKRAGKPTVTAIQALKAANVAPSTEH